jgi:hypothetical protein
LPCHLVMYHPFIWIKDEARCRIFSLLRLSHRLVTLRPLKPLPLSPVICFKTVNLFIWVRQEEMNIFWATFERVFHWMSVGVFIGQIKHFGYMGLSPQPDMSNMFVLWTPCPFPLYLSGMC